MHVVLVFTHLFSEVDEPRSLITVLRNHLTCIPTIFSNNAY